MVESRIQMSELHLLRLQRKVERLKKLVWRFLSDDFSILSFLLIRQSRCFGNRLTVFAARLSSALVSKLQSVP